MRKKYLFLDIDGTLVNFDGTMPDSAAYAIRAAQQRGHELIICTGRQRSQVYPWLLQKADFAGTVTSGGALVICGGRLISHICFPGEQLRRALSYLEEKRIAYTLQTAGVMYSKSWCMEKIVSSFVKNGFGPESFAELFGETRCEEPPEARDDAEKILYYDAGLGAKALQRDLGEDYHVIGCSFLGQGEQSGEIAQAGVDKAAGLRAYMEYRGADIADTVAFGDSDNDLELFEAAGCCVAMGNAGETLKRAATHITAPIDGDGLYRAFKHLELI